jgi:hypothetical protein
MVWIRFHSGRVPGAICGEIVLAFFVDYVAVFEVLDDVLSINDVHCCPSPVVISLEVQTNSWD